MDFGSCKAMMFDFDGTVTAEGFAAPDGEMVDLLVELARKMPISFCTGRQLESFERHGLNFILAKADDAALKNLFFVGENGAIGYFYNLETRAMEEFYQVAWPENFLARAKCMKDLDERVKEFGNVIFDAHQIVVVARTNARDQFEHPEGEVELMRELSGKIYKVMVSYLQEIDPDYERFLQVGNSGIGVVISPTGGNKDRGIEEFGRFLVAQRGMDFSEEFREIFVIGDRPDKEGNDHFFLNGRLGTPFSVGQMVEGATYPLPVIDENGKRLLHDAGTKWMVGRVIMNNEQWIENNE